MGLTFPGAEAFVEQVYADLRSRYPAMPSGVTFGDEPSGDFGIAHAYDDFVTFDNDRLPVLYVACHELGHELEYNVDKKRGDPFTSGLYDEFWKVRGFPGTPMEAQQKAIALNNAGDYKAAYRLWPLENFADAFGAVNSYGQGTLITETYGAYLDEPKLRAFYASLEGADMAITPEDIAQIKAALAPMFLDVLQKLDSGFNTTLPTLIDRASAGDKKVSTAPIDQ